MTAKSRQAGVFQSRVLQTSVCFACLLVLLTTITVPGQVSKIYLGDIAAGGDGTGTAQPEIVGIHPDTGLLELAHLNGPIGITDGLALQPVDDTTSELIDSVFIIEAEEMPISTTGVTFTFPPEDLLAPAQTWDHILANRIGGEDFLISVGGVTFDQGVGIHATAGITYDLDALRAYHGAAKIGQIAAYAGMGDSPACLASPGTVTAYVIVSDDAQVLDSDFHRSSTDGKWIFLPIPAEAKFLTLAAGAGNGQYYCNSGTFGGAFITPPGVCLSPPAAANRDLKPFRSPEEGSGDFKAGDVIPVEITLSEIRLADPNCGAPAGAVIKEMLPAGWAPSEISDGGAYDAGTATISWLVAGPAFAEGKKLTYKVTAPPVAPLESVFNGTIAEDVPFSEAFLIRGESKLLADIPFDACGGIRAWNILGAYVQPFGDNPGDDNLRLDYLTDRDSSELDFVFFPGGQVPTAFGGDGVSGAASLGILDGARGRNPGGAPTVFAWNDADARIDLNGDAFGGNPDNVMAYAQAYVINTTGTPIEVNIASSSDDSVQILLNGEEAWIHSIPRGGSDACVPQDISPDGFVFTSPFVLEPGENNLVVKVWEGGGAWDFAVRFQDSGGNPITDGLEVRKYPLGVDCVLPPLLAVRSISTGKTVSVQCVEEPRWSEGETYSVSVALSGVRGVAPAPCQAPSSVTIVETVPEGWTPSEASSGGVIAGQKITWRLEGAAIAATNLTYKVKAGGGLQLVYFRGGIEEADSPLGFAVTGTSALANPSDITDQGFFKTWLLLGPYQQPPGLVAAPGLANIRKDHLTDGAGTTEKDVSPRPGDTVSTAYGPQGPARSIGLSPPATPNGINPGGVPTWKEWRDQDDTINFNDYYGGDLNQVMMYAVTYLVVEADIVVDIGVASDDSVQVLLDGAEIHARNIGRGPGAANEVQDVVLASAHEALNPLTAGHHKLMVKIFEGGGGHAFRLRLQDPLSGEPVLEGVQICLSPSPAECGDEPPPPAFHRGDADGNGELQLTDAVRILGFLFLGQAAPGCLDAADADDNSLLQLTDAVRILGFLFLGQAAPAPPGPPPSPCGPDPSGGELGCVGYAGC